MVLLSVVGHIGGVAVGHDRGGVVPYPHGSPARPGLRSATALIVTSRRHASRGLARVLSAGRQNPPGRSLRRPGLLVGRPTVRRRRPASRLHRPQTARQLTSPWVPYRSGAAGAPTVETDEQPAVAVGDQAWAMGCSGVRRTQVPVSRRAGRAPGSAGRRRRWPAPATAADLRERGALGLAQVGRGPQQRQRSGRTRRPAPVEPERTGSRSRSRPATPSARTSWGPHADRRQPVHRGGAAPWCRAGATRSAGRRSSRASVTPTARALGGRSRPRCWSPAATRRRRAAGGSRGRHYAHRAGPAAGRTGPTGGSARASRSSSTARRGRCRKKPGPALVAGHDPVVGQPVDDAQVAEPSCRTARPPGRPEVSRAATPPSGCRPARRVDPAPRRPGPRPRVSTVGWVPVRPARPRAPGPRTRVTARAVPGRPATGGDLQPGRVPSYRRWDVGIRRRPAPGPGARRGRGGVRRQHLGQRRAGHHEGRPGDVARRTELQRQHGGHRPRVVARWRRRPPARPRRFRSTSIGSASVVPAMPTPPDAWRPRRPGEAGLRALPLSWWAEVSSDIALSRSTASRIATSWCRHGP